MRILNWQERMDLARKVEREARKRRVIENGLFLAISAFAVYLVWNLR